MTAAGTPELLRPVVADVRETTEIGRFLGWLERERGLRFDGYPDLHRWSVEDLEGFWSAVAAFFDVRFATAPQRVLGRWEMPGAEWFPGGTLNYAGSGRMVHPHDVVPGSCLTQPCEALSRRLAGPRADCDAPTR